MNAYLIAILCFLAKVSATTGLVTYYLDEKCPDYENTLQLSDSQFGSAIILEASRSYFYKPDFKCNLKLVPPFGSGIIVSIDMVQLQAGFDPDTLVLKMGSKVVRSWSGDSISDTDDYITTDPYGDPGSSVTVRMESKGRYLRQKRGFRFVVTTYQKYCYLSGYRTCGGIYDRCIRKNLFCNGYNNCGTNYDESGCSGSGTSVGGIIGIVTFIIMFIVLSIICRCLCNQRKRNINARRLTAPVVIAPPPQSQPLPRPINTVSGQTMSGYNYGSVQSPGYNDANYGQMPEFDPPPPYSGFKPEVMPQPQSGYPAPTYPGQQYPSPPQNPAPYPPQHYLNPPQNPAPTHPAAVNPAPAYPGQQYPSPPQNPYFNPQSQSQSQS